MQFTGSVLLLTLFLPFTSYLIYQAVLFFLILLFSLIKRRDQMRQIFSVSVIALLLAVFVVSSRFDINNQRLATKQDIVVGFVC